MERLHRLSVYGRWSLIIILWAVLGTFSLWLLRHEIVMLRRNFTWAALRYGLAFNPFASFGLIACIGPTVGMLLWQSRNILFGLPQPEIQRLEKQVRRLRQQGPSHPLWKWVTQPKVADRQ